MATWEDFLRTLGTQVNVLGTQCVAVANYYHRDVLGLPLPGGIASAYQWYTTFPNQPNLYNNYTRFPAGTTTAQVGDIVVENRDRSNGEHGHICVVVSAWNGSFFETYDQNVNGVQRVFKLRKTGGTVMGYLRPNNGVAFAEEVLTEEQRKMLDEIYAATRLGSTGIQARLNAIKNATDSIYQTVSELVVRGATSYTQKDDRAMTQDFLNQVLDLLDDIDAGFTVVGYDNIAEPAQINYYSNEADPGESSVQDVVRDELDKTKIIK